MKKESSIQIDLKVRSDSLTPNDIQKIAQNIIEHATYHEAEFFIDEYLSEEEREEFYNNDDLRTNFITGKSSIHIFEDH